MPVALLAPLEHRWECPNCPQVAVTHGSQPHARFHACAGLSGFTAPLVAAGIKAKVAVELREDYIGGEDVQMDATGRPIMAIRTTRDDGEDLAVYAPTAHMGGSA